MPRRKFHYSSLQKTIFIVIILITVGVIYYLVTAGKPNSPSVSISPTTITGSGSSTSPAASYAILSPATVAPKVAECSEALSYSSLGVPGPLSCTNGDLNIQAWQSLSAQEPKVMSLGYSANISQVQSAICSDAQAAASDSAPGADNAIEISAYDIANLYFGWNFSSDPTSVLSSGNC